MADLSPSSKFAQHSEDPVNRNIHFEALSEYIWELKEEDQRYSISWHIIERTQLFNPITLQCKLCLSEIVNLLLLNPAQASLNKKSECYQSCRHRKKFLLAYSKPLALKGGALTYRYKRWNDLFEVYFLCINSNINQYLMNAWKGMKLPVVLNKFLWRTCPL